MFAAVYSISTRLYASACQTVFASECQFAFTLVRMHRRTTYVYIHVCTWSNVVVHVCMCVCEYVRLTSKAAADREHYSNGAYPPLTAKKPDIYLQHEPLLEVVTHNTHWHTHWHTHARTLDLDHCVCSHSQKASCGIWLWTFCKVLLLFLSY